MTTMDKDKIESIKTWLGAGSINIFGPQFSGKETQCRALVNFFDGELIGSGQILRDNTSPEEVKNHMGSGFMFPTESFKQIVFPYLNQPALSGKPLILSSVGRYKGEEEDAVEALEQSSHPIKAVIYLKLDEQITWNRYEVAKQKNDRGKRHDDSKEALVTRLEEFKNKTMPVIEFYRQKGLLVEVNGDQTPDEVTEEILEKLYVFTKS